MLAAEEQRLAGLTATMSSEVADLENELVTLKQRLKDETARTKIAASDELRVRHCRASFCLLAVSSTVFFQCVRTNETSLYCAFWQTEISAWKQKFSDEQSELVAGAKAAYAAQTSRSEAAAALWNARARDARNDHASAGTLDTSKQSLVT